MKGILLILCAAALMLAGFPLMRKLDAFLERSLVPPEQGEDDPQHSRP